LSIKGSNVFSASGGSSYITRSKITSIISRMITSIISGMITSVITSIISSMINCACEIGSGGVGLFNYSNIRSAYKGNIIKVGECKICCTLCTISGVIGTS
jgi:hypothetical protein